MRKEGELEQWKARCVPVKGKSRKEARSISNVQTGDEVLGFQMLSRWTKDTTAEYDPDWSNCIQENEYGATEVPGTKRSGKPSFSFRRKLRIKKSASASSPRNSRAPGENLEIKQSVPPQRTEVGLPSSEVARNPDEVGRECFQPLDQMNRRIRMRSRKVRRPARGKSSAINSTTSLEKKEEAQSPLQWREVNWNVGEGDQKWKRTVYDTSKQPECLPRTLAKDRKQTEILVTKFPSPVRPDRRIRRANTFTPRILSDIREINPPDNFRGKNKVKSGDRIFEFSRALVKDRQSKYPEAHISGKKPLSQGQESTTPVPLTRSKFSIAYNDVVRSGGISFERYANRQVLRDADYSSLAVLSETGQCSALQDDQELMEIRDLVSRFSQKGLSFTDTKDILKEILEDFEQDDYALPCRPWHDDQDKRPGSRRDEDGDQSELAIQHVVHTE